ncbi:MAG TPA: hypothetical protein VKH46_01250 [Thermoanaerobaculia bacterium]|jgi:hypothetical protein|nr:hypothetical protein [Thermoanaerobaculia bacterium]
MKARIALLLLAVSAAASAQTTNPNPKNFRMLIDGGETPGVAGFAIDFERSAAIAYSPRLVVAPAQAPRLTLNLTPKGLSALSGWLNDAGNGVSVAARSIEIQSLDNEETVLIDWRIDGAVPIAISQLSSGNGTSPLVAVILQFEKLTLVKAKSD